MSSSQDFIRLFVQYHDFIRGVAFRTFPFSDHVEDIVQQVYAELLARKEPLDLNRDLRPFLASVTVHIARAQWRQKQKYSPEHLRKIAEHVQTIAGEQVRPEEYEYKMQTLQQCLALLPEKSRKLIQLRYFDDLKMREIAERLNLKTNTVCRAVARLRDQLNLCMKNLLAEKKANEEPF